MAFKSHPITASVIKPKFNFMALDEEGCPTRSISRGEDSKITGDSEGNTFLLSNVSSPILTACLYMRVMY